VSIIDSQSGGSDSQNYFVEAGRHDTAIRALRAATIPQHGTVQTTGPVDLITMVGYNLGTTLTDTLVGLELCDATSGQGHHQDITPGRYSFRVSVDQSSSRKLLDNLHKHFVE
ncbi:MAG: hypothetical protein ABI354_02670, partial [Candidatus Saccharimonadales bacterium]